MTGKTSKLTVKMKLQHPGSLQRLLVVVVILLTVLCFHAAVSVTGDENDAKDMEAELVLEEVGVIPGEGLYVCFTGIDGRPPDSSLQYSTTYSHAQGLTVGTCTGDIIQRTHITNGSLSYCLPPCPVSEGSVHHQPMSVVVTGHDRTTKDTTTALLESISLPDTRPTVLDLGKGVLEVRWEGHPDRRYRVQLWHHHPSTIVTTDSAQTKEDVGDNTDTDIVKPEELTIGGAEPIVDIVEEVSNISEAQTETNEGTDSDPVLESDVMAQEQSLEIESPHVRDNSDSNNKDEAKVISEGSDKSSDKTGDTITKSHVEERKVSEEIVNKKIVSKNETVQEGNSSVTGSEESKRMESKMSAEEGSEEDGSLEQDIRGTETGVGGTKDGIVKGMEGEVGEEGSKDNELPEQEKTRTEMGVGETKQEVVNEMSGEVGAEQDIKGTVKGVSEAKEEVVNGAGEVVGEEQSIKGTVKGEGKTEEDVLKGMEKGVGSMEEGIRRQQQQEELAKNKSKNGGMDADTMAKVRQCYHDLKNESEEDDDDDDEDSDENGDDDHEEDNDDFIKWKRWRSCVAKHSPPAPLKVSSPHLIHSSDIITCSLGTCVYYATSAPLSCCVSVEIMDVTDPVVISTHTVPMNPRRWTELTLDTVEVTARHEYASPPTTTMTTTLRRTTHGKAAAGVAADAAGGATGGGAGAAAGAGGDGAGGSNTQEMQVEGTARHLQAVLINAHTFTHALTSLPEECGLVSGVCSLRSLETLVDKGDEAASNFILLVSDQDTNTSAVIPFNDIQVRVRQVVEGVVLVLWDKDHTAQEFETRVVPETGQPSEAVTVACSRKGTDCLATFRGLTPGQYRAEVSYGAHPRRVFTAPFTVHKEGQPTYLKFLDIF